MGRQSLYIAVYAADVLDALNEEVEFGDMSEELNAKQRAIVLQGVRQVVTQLADEEWEAVSRSSEQEYLEYLTNSLKGQIH